MGSLLSSRSSRASIEQDEGEIFLGGKLHEHLTPIESILNGIQVIYQDFCVFPNLSVAENISLNFQLFQRKKLVNWRRIDQIATDALASIGIEMNLREKVESLSVADKQLIAISRALLHDAKLIIMDEPTTALTKREVEILFSIIKNLEAKGISVLFVSHKLNEVFEISERFTVLRNGKNVVTGETAQCDNAQFVYYLTGRKFEESYFEHEHTGMNPLLTVQNFCRKDSFADVSFDLYPGEILGISGLLGSGRAELALALFGLSPTDSGTLSIKGKPVNLRSPQEGMRNGIGYVPDDRLTAGLFLPQSIGRNIILSRLPWFSKWFGILDQKGMHGEMDKWVKNLAIATPSSAFSVQTLSGGNQQRVVLAKWLATHPEILIMNGPTVGVDIGSKFDIHRILRELASHGVGVIIISDDIPEVLMNCNRVLVMRVGRIVGEVKGKDITEKELARWMAGDDTVAPYVTEKRG